MNSHESRGQAELKADFARNTALRERQLLAKATLLDNIRRQEEQAHQVNLSRLGSPRAFLNTTSPTFATETIGKETMNVPRLPVIVPVGKERELPEPAVMVLRGLWARLGYQSNSFVDMQLEIAKELELADFARFEREMLCNEVISLRQELDLLRAERNEQARRADEAQANLAQVIESEERTFKALVTEREIAKRAIEQAEKGVQQVVIAKEKEAVRAGVMSEEIHRLEKEKLAAVLYARTAEEQAALANITAKTAAAVAMSAVHTTQAGTPRLGHAPTTPRSPAISSLPQTTSAPHIPRSRTPSNALNNHNPHHLSSTPRSTLTGPPSHIPSRPHTPHLSSAMAQLNTNWTDADEAILRSKIREKQIEIEENRLAADAARLAQDRLNLKIDRDRLASPRIRTPKVSYQDLRN